MEKEAIEILLEIKEKITNESDLMWTSYEDAKELRDEIDNYIIRIQKSDKSVFKDIYVHFLPTATFQEHSMQNGWSARYMQLAERFDKIYELNK